MKLKELANEFPDVVMLKVDVDECEEAAIEYNIQSMPTFVYLKSKKEVKLKHLFNTKFWLYYIYISFFRLFDFLVPTMRN